MSNPQNGAEVLARIRPRLNEDVARICLRPDLLKDWEAANEALAEALAEDSGKRQVGNAAAKRKATELAEKVQEIEAEIEATEARFTFRAMTKDDWRSLCDEHPPRKGDEVDQFVGYNRDAVDDAAIRECLIDPIYEDCTKPECQHGDGDCYTWQRLLKVCNPTEWAELRETVRTVNGATTNPPKSQLASRTLARGGSGSK